MNDEQIRQPTDGFPGDGSCDADIAVLEAYRAAYRAELKRGESLSAEEFVRQNKLDQRLLPALRATAAL